MKSYKKIVPAIAMLVISAITLTSASYAWFSMNRQVTATGMNVTVKSESSLVIANELGDVGVGTKTTHSFTTSTSALIPATHNTSFTGTCLQYNTTASGIDAAKGTGTVSLATAVNTETEKYYVDYVVYIASAGSQLAIPAGQNLNVSIASTAPETLGDTLKATSVDFYVEEDSGSGTDVTPSSDSFKGTLNLAGFDATVNDFSTTKTAIPLLTDTKIIPPNKSTTDYLKVTMRVYFDGALLQGSDQCFVYSDTIDTNQVNFDATFKIEEE